MPDEGQKSKLFSKFHHLFSKEETTKVSEEKPQSNLRIGKLVLPDEVATPPDRLSDAGSEEQQQVPEEKLDLDIQFAQNLIKLSAKFIYCETVQELVYKMHSLKTENNWGYIFAWESKLKDIFENNSFQDSIIGFTIENSNAAASTCESLIADTGNILLSSKQATRRQLPVFPKTHIIIADQSQLKANLEEAIDAFQEKHKDELPSIINLSKEPRVHLENQKVPVLEAVGPSDIYVFMVDEILS